MPCSLDIPSSMTCFAMPDQMHPLLVLYTVPISRICWKAAPSHVALSCYWEDEWNICSGTSWIRTSEKPFKTIQGRLCANSMCQRSWDHKYVVHQLTLPPKNSSPLHRSLKKKDKANSLPLFNICCKSQLICPIYTIEQNIMQIFLYLFTRGKACLWKEGPIHFKTITLKVENQNVATMETKHVNAPK